MSPEMADLYARLRGAEYQLVVLANKARADGDMDEMRRLRGKVEGVKLAIDYLRSYEVQP